MKHRVGHDRKRGVGLAVLITLLLIAVLGIWWIFREAGEQPGPELSATEIITLTA